MTLRIFCITFKRQNDINEIIFSVDKNLRGVVYCNALRHSDTIVSDWNFLWDSLRSETLTSERDTMVAALGCARNEAVLKL